MKKITLLIVLAILGFTAKAQVTETFATNPETSGWTLVQTTWSAGKIELAKKSTGGYVTTPSISNPSSITIKTNNSGATNRSLQVQYSSDGNSWTDLVLFTVTAKVETHTHNIASSLGSVQFKLVNEGTNPFVITEVTIAGTAAPSSAAEVTAFTIPNQVGSSVINSTAKTIAVDMSVGTNKTALVPIITLSAKASVAPASGAAQDFTNPVVYTVTAEDGTTKTWTVTVTLKASSEKEVTAFSLCEVQIGNATINSATGTIAVRVPEGTNLTSIAPQTLTLSSGANILPLASATQNFTSPVTYTVTAQDGTTKTWTVTVTPVAPATSVDFSLTGFASENGGTTGGNNAVAPNIYEVRTVAELEAAIGTKKNGGSTPRIIKIMNSLDNGGTDIAIKECANITLYGNGENILISKMPIIITSSSNIIIRNLKFTMVGAGGGKDIIEVTTTSSSVSHHIWIDHCEFYNETPTVAGSNSASTKDKYDGLLDMKKNSEYITVSWCYFHDHYKAILVGFTTADTYDRKITLHHNRFVRINSRIPSFRGGTAHIYNNYYEGWIENGNPQGTCINTREGANLLVENNYFKDVNQAVYCALEDVATPGFAHWGDGANGNQCENVTKCWAETAGTPNNPFYPPYYSDVVLDPAANIPAMTLEYAGVGKISAYDDYGTGGSGSGGNKAPVITITSPEAYATFGEPASVTLTATAVDTDGSVSKVEFYINGELAQTFTSGTYTHTFNELIAGTYSLMVKAYDNENKVGSRAVTIVVTPEPIKEGESLIGTNTANGYFWFNEANADKANELLSSGIISGDSIKFEPTKNVATESFIGDFPIGIISVRKNGNDIIFKLPSCSIFKLYLTRSGDFGGSASVSSNGNDWSSISTLSGKKGILEVDYSEDVASQSEVYVKIVNSTTGTLNVHGAIIILADTTGRGGGDDGGNDDGGDDDNDDSSTGVGKGGKTNLALTYPNPVSSELCVSNGGGYTYMQIINLNGSVVLTYKVVNGENIYNVSSLHKGAYFAKFSGKGKAEVHRFTKK